YEPPAPLASRFALEPYQGEVAAADAALGALLEPLLAEGLAERTLVLLTSDHGESLGEHGEATHGIFAYEATLRVPLIVYAPRILSPRVVREPVRHVDVLPTVLDALGLETPAGLPGRSLLPLAAGHDEVAPLGYFEALSSSLNQGWAPLRGVRRDHLKYIDLPLPELYDLRADPREERNLAATRPDDLAALRALLTGLRSRERQVSRVSEDTAVTERLRALGYLAGGQTTTKERYGEADDPKRLVALDKVNSEIVSLFRAREWDKAAALCRKLIADRPDSPLAWSSLASIERSRGDLPKAIDAARRALSLRPGDAEGAALLAVYLTEAGRARESLPLLAPFLEAGRPDPDLLTAQGMAQAQLGRRSEALAAFARAAQDDPTNAMVLVNTATVHLMTGDLEPARRAFEAALALDPDLARVHNGLGVIAAQQGRLEEAVARWKEAARLEPWDHQALFNLGSTLRRLGRQDDARPYLEAYLRAAPAAAEGRDIARVRGWLGEPAGK
ncbi:MAG TPA: tetratricopeptide repeat protein, partial [Vicinamibacteria bacterium]